jgi:hypothetical protein
MDHASTFKRFGTNCSAKRWPTASCAPKARGTKRSLKTHSCALPMPQLVNAISSVSWGAHTNASQNWRRGSGQLRVSPAPPQRALSRRPGERRIAHRPRVRTAARARPGRGQPRRSVRKRQPSAVRCGRQPDDIRARGDNRCIEMSASIASLITESISRQGATAILRSYRQRFDECVYERGPFWDMIAPAESPKRSSLRQQRHESPIFCQFLP